MSQRLQLVRQQAEQGHPDREVKYEDARMVVGGQTERCLNDERTGDPDSGAEGTAAARRGPQPDSDEYRGGDRREDQQRADQLVHVDCVRMVSANEDSRQDRLHQDADCDDDGQRKGYRTAHAGTCGGWLVLCAAHGYLTFLGMLDWMFVVTLTAGEGNGAEARRNRRVIGLRIV
jgi:hypothetical protein